MKSRILALVLLTVAGLASSASAQSPLMWYTYNMMPPPRPSLPPYSPNFYHVPNRPQPGRMASFWNGRINPGHHAPAAGFEGLPVQDGSAPEPEPQGLFARWRNHRLSR